MKKKYITMIVIGTIIVGILVIYKLYVIDKKMKNKDSWKIEITNIISKDIKGNAYDKEKPTFNKTSASFKPILVSPGDSIKYDITIKNKGKKDAKLKKINLTNTDNPAIIFKTSGIKEKDTIKSKKEKNYTIIIKYKDDIKTKPDTLKSSLKIKLDFIQK